MKKFLALALIMIMALSCISTAFAAGETIHHTGTSKYGYTSTGSVPQKTDNSLLCTGAQKAPSNASVYARAVIYSGGTWQQVSSSALPFAYYADLYIYDSTYVRDVHVQIQNEGDWYGTSVTTTGDWTLYA